MPHDVVSDQGQHCLLTGLSIKNRIKATNRPDNPKMTNRLVQHITVEESISIQEVNGNTPGEATLPFSLMPPLSEDNSERKKKCFTRSKFFPLRVGPIYERFCYSLKKRVGHEGCFPL